MRPDTRPRQRCQPGEGYTDDRDPERRNQTLEPRHSVRQPEVIGVGPFVKQAIRRERTRAPPRRRPLQSHVERATVLLIIHAELVHSRVQPQRADQRMHVGRRCPPNHEFAVQPDIEAVVARAVQFDFARFGQVPETAPAHAEKRLGRSESSSRKSSAMLVSTSLRSGAPLKPTSGNTCRCRPVRSAALGLTTNSTAVSVTAAATEAAVRPPSCCRLSRGRRSPTATDPLMETCLSLAFGEIQRAAPRLPDWPYRVSLPLDGLDYLLSRPCTEGDVPDTIRS